MERRDFKKIKQLLNVCYQCGTCVSTCAAGLVSPDKNIRKLVQNLVNSKNEFEPQENDLVWLCTTCYQCEDRCPEGIPLTTLLIQLKNMAVEVSVIPDSIRKEIETLAAHSFTYPPTKSIVSRRRRLALPELPQPDEAEMQTLIKLVASPDESTNSEEPKT
jgi:heterodisulfide reductase subunit C